MPKKVKSEGAHERNDTVFLEKMDGGLYVDTDAYLEGGYIHMDEAGWSYRPSTDRKTPVYGFNVNGHPPTQEGLVYYRDEEAGDPLLDQHYLNRVLPNTFLAGSEGRLHDDRGDRRFRHTANLIMSIMAFGIIISTVLVNSSACGPDIHVVREAQEAVDQGPKDGQ